MTDIDRRLAELAERFAAQAGDAAASIEGSRARRDWPALSTACHSLAGRAGMFGYPDLGEAARAVEEAIDERADAARIGELTELLLLHLEPLRQGR